MRSPRKLLAALLVGSALTFGAGACDDDGNDDDVNVDEPLDEETGEDEGL